MCPLTVTKQICWLCKCTVYVGRVRTNFTGGPGRMLDLPKRLRAATPTTLEGIAVFVTIKRGVSVSLVDFPRLFQGWMKDEICDRRSRLRYLRYNINIMNWSLWQGMKLPLSVLMNVYILCLNFPTKNTEWFGSTKFPVMVLCILVLKSWREFLVLIHCRFRESVNMS